MPQRGKERTQPVCHIISMHPSAHSHFLQAASSIYTNRRGTPSQTREQKEWLNILFFIMDHIPLQLRSFKLHLIIPMNCHARLPKTLTLVHLPRSNEILLEIIGVIIPPNKSAHIILRCVRSAGVTDEVEVVFKSTVHVYIRGEKAFKEIFWRGVRWELEREVIGFVILAEVSVVMSGGFLMRERVKLSRTRFCPELPTILEEDEEEDEKEEDEEEDEKEEDEEEDEKEEDGKEEMGRWDDLDYIDKIGKDDGDGAVKKCAI